MALKEDLKWLPFVAEFRANGTDVTGLNTAAFTNPLTILRSVNYLNIQSISCFGRVYESTANSRAVPFLVSNHQIDFGAVGSPTYVLDTPPILTVAPLLNQRPLVLPFSDGTHNFGDQYIYQISPLLTEPTLTLRYTWGDYFGWGSPDGIAAPIMNFYSSGTLLLDVACHIRGYYAI